MFDRQPAPPIDAEALELLVEMIGPDEPAAVLDLLDTYLEDSARQVEDLQAAYAAGDFKNVHRIEHSMKSSSATFGALGLSKHCERLEHAARENCQNANCARLLEDVRNEYARVVVALTGERERFLGS